MKIVMLGNSGAGKTTYLSLMYSELQLDVGGFRVSCADAGQHRQLLAAAEAIRHGRYPSPTNQRSVHELTLSFGGVTVLPFTWRDHRGGAASGRTTDAADVAELHTDLLESDAIVLFVDGVELTTRPAAERMVGRLTGHVLRAVRTRQEVVTPLVIAVTKCDLLDLDDQKVIDAILAPFAELMEAVAATQHIHGTVLPLSCGPTPVNVALPVLWSLRFGVVGRVMRLAAEIEQSTAKAALAAGRDTLADRLGSWWRDERSWAAIAQAHRNEALAAHQQFQALEPPAERLDELLDDVAAF